MCRIGVELTFVPDRRGSKEFPTRTEAKRAARQLNQLLRKLDCPVSQNGMDILIRFVAKAERFRMEDGKWVGHIVEVNATPFDHTLLKDEVFVAVVQLVFDYAAKLKLLPRIRRRGVHHASGGGHILCGTAYLFDDDIHFTGRLAAFEKAWYVDFANRPYIRWLFAEWFDCGENSNVAVTSSDLSYGAWDSNHAYTYSLARGSIRRRFSDDMKPSYAAYEVRLFDAQTCVADVIRDINFLVAWVTRVRDLVLLEQTIEFNLTAKRYEKWCKPRAAWGEVSRFLRLLKLDPRDYRSAFEDNYLNRIKHGKMT